MTAITSDHHIIIVGCGRVGAELALALCAKRHRVTVLDANQDAFDRLGSDFTGRTVQGDGMDQTALKRAGIGEAHALAATSSSDSVNIVVARMAQEIFKLDHVVARVYNPRRMPVYDQLGIRTIASSSWAAQRIEDILLHPGMRSIHSAGSGEVQIYEIVVPDHWVGQTIVQVLPADVVPVALERSGQGVLPTASTVLQDNDVLLVSARDFATVALRERIAAPEVARK
jgi:trk system potassium uptake protein TrkA